jgi:hypothetical protein
MNGKWIGEVARDSGGSLEVMPEDLVKAFTHLVRRHTADSEASSSHGRLPEAHEAIDLLKANARSYPTPKMFFRDPDGYVLKAVPVASILEKFFPDFKDFGNGFSCPVPITKDFWYDYSERVHDFLKAALAFRSAVAPPLGHYDFENLRQLEWFLEPIGLSLSLDSNNQIREQWVCPSLLSAFGRMAFQDASAGRRVLSCECCANPFVTSSYQARYCTPQCGWKHRKQRSRSAKSAHKAQE